MNLKDKGVQFLTYDIWIASFKTQKKISKTFQFLKEASLNFAENCKSISNSLTPKIALRLCISAVIPIKHIFQQADRKQDRWSSLSSNNMQNMIKNIQCTVSYLENAFIFLCFVHLLISTEIPHRWEFQIDNAFREEACNHQLGMWLIHKLKGMRWPTRFQRSKKRFCFLILDFGDLADTNLTTRLFEKYEKFFFHHFRF